MKLYSFKLLKSSKKKSKIYIEIQAKKCDIMSMIFERKLPIPQEVKEQYPLSYELEKLVRFLKGKTKDIIVFSGYPIGELSKNIYSAAVLKEITVLVDGEYDENKNIGDVLRGSTNQKIHFLGEGVDDKFVETYTKYQQIYNGKYATENFRVNDGVISVGIHKKDFKQQLEETLKDKDIVKIKNNEEKR